MGLIGIRIRIAQKEKIIPEFELKEKITKKKSDAKPDVESDAKSESEEIVIEEEKIKKMKETLEEEEAEFK